MIRSALEDECMAKALKDRIEGLKVRLARFEERSQSKRQVVRESMELADIPKLAEPDFTASLRLGPPSANILDEDELPIEFLIPQAAKPDRRGILEALTGGAVVAGAVLGQPKTTLAIRSH